MTFEEYLNHMVESILGDAGDNHVVLGPVVRVSEGVRGFTIATAGPDRQFRVDAIDGDKTLRETVKTAMLARRPPLIIHDLDDELSCARLCAALWPGEEIKSLVKQIEAERA